MKQLYKLKGEGRSIRAIARDLGVSRNSVRKYLRSPQVPRAKEPTPRGSRLDPYKEYLRERLAEGLENCVVLLRELRGRGRHEFVEGIAVYDSQQVMGFHRILAGNPEQLVVNYHVYVVDQRCCRYAVSTVDHTNRPVAGISLPLQLGR